MVNFSWKIRAYVCEIAMVCLFVLWMFNLLFLISFYVKNKIETEKTLREKCLGQNPWKRSKASSLRIVFTRNLMLRWKVSKKSEKKSEPKFVKLSWFVYLFFECLTYCFWLRFVLKSKWKPKRHLEISVSVKTVKMVRKRLARESFSREI